MNNEDVAKVEEEMRNFREENSELIERNRRRMNKGIFQSNSLYRIV